VLSDNHRAKSLLRCVDATPGFLAEYPREIEKIRKTITIVVRRPPPNQQKKQKLAGSADISISA
jgi:hypothetical protein